MVSKRVSVLAAIAAVAAVVTGTALACGDKLVALGGGVGFERVVMSRHPGRIVLLAEPATGLAAANDRFNIASGLALAGHDVQVVKDSSELGRPEHGHTPDLILVDVSRVGQLQLHPTVGSKVPIILPIAYAGAGDAVAAPGPQDGCVTIANGRKGAPVLQAVEKALKLRSRGLHMPCEAKYPGQQA